MCGSPNAVACLRGRNAVAGNYASDPARRDEADGAIPWVADASLAACRGVDSLEQVSIGLCQSSCYGDVHAAMHKMPVQDYNIYGAQSAALQA
eukprot:104318-Amphidinium_carterae.1